MKAGKRIGRVTAGALLALLLGVALMYRSARAPASSGAESSESSAQGSGTPGQPASGLRSGVAKVDPGKARAEPRPAGVFGSYGWGSGEDQLGRDRPTEGNPTAPMSLTFDRLGNVVVLDQVNGRLVRLGPDGKALDTIPLTVQSAQDVAIAKDGTIAVLDRLADKTIALHDATGRPMGNLALEGKGLAQGGLSTGLFVEGDSVYVEAEHGPLIRVGGLDGTSDTERPQLPGRPSRDGKSFLSANLGPRGSRKVYVHAVDRDSRQHRFSREYSLPLPVLTLMMLDSDASGVIYVAVSGEEPHPPEEVRPKHWVRLLCLDPLDGAPLGTADLPSNAMPEETFRDFAVPDSGGVLYSVRTPEGTTLQRYTCR
ncbi:hypothetical protein ATI61_1052 [Archangium gephyra]|uniref:Uncharacterized protein n=1 Tax=Archangium gephyra TaxID=48 RepID=A0AAC8TIP1_9BACT|nr:hypothetical protein [Archangium gephyra]AKJ07035.1 Hypothetical protein AA314_08661 [Archangium gephyra]REG31678.1 hypothetical protein ATI61_1052 [Archangium gephyra]